MPGICAEQQHEWECIANSMPRPKCWGVWENTSLLYFKKMACGKYVHLRKRSISRAVFIMFFIRTLEPTLPRRNSRDTLYISKSEGSLNMLNAACSRSSSVASPVCKHCCRPTCTVMWPGMWSLMPGGGALPKNMWRVCAATLTPIFKPPVTEWPLFIFHILLSPNDPYFQNALFLEIFIGENGRHALTEWRPFSPINDHLGLVICTQYLFGRRDLCHC